MSNNRGKPNQSRNTNSSYSQNSQRNADSNDRNYYDSFQSSNKRERQQYDWQKKKKREDKPNNDVHRPYHHNQRYEPKKSFESTNQQKIPQHVNINLEESTTNDGTNIGIQDTRRNLPIYVHRDSILEAIKNHQVTIISGETGSGKTTQVPQYILEDLEVHNLPANIVVTQPRRIAAVSIAKRVSEERQESIGQSIGYHIGLGEKQLNPNTKVVFMTTGILLQRLMHHKSLESLTHVILDEVHERDLDSDFAMLVVKEFLFHYKHVKLILMSATFDSELFAKYYPLSVQEIGNVHIESRHKNHHRLYGGEITADEIITAPIVKVSGKCYPVEISYVEDILTQLKFDRNSRMARECSNFNGDNASIDSQLYELASHLISHIDTIHDKKREHESILVFLPGLGEIEDMYSLLNEDNKNLWILPLHSSISSEEQSKVFQRAPSGLRKVILATNIAESSITVPDVVFVIDFCMVKTLYFDPGTNLQSLQLKWESKASAVQRAGRAGRVTNGFVFRMVTKAFYETLQSFSAPEMQRSPLEQLILQVKILEIGAPEDVLKKALQPPNFNNIDAAVRNLIDVGALTLEGHLTALGRIYANLPVDVKIAKLLVIASVFGVGYEALVIGAGLSLKSVFTKPFGSGVESFKYRLLWSCNSDSDHVAILNAFIKWQLFKQVHHPTSRQELDWTRKHHLSIKTLREMSDLMNELRTRLSHRGIKIAVPLQQYQQEYRNLDLRQNPYPMQMNGQALLVLQIVLFGSLFPNYLNCQYEEPRMQDQSYRSSDNDPKLTLEIPRLPNYVTEGKLRDLFKECGNIAKIYIAHNTAYIRFKDLRSLQLGLRLSSSKRLSVSDNNTRPNFNKPRNNNNSRKSNDGWGSSNNGGGWGSSTQSNSSWGSSTSGSWGSSSSSWGSSTSSSSPNHNSNWHDEEYEAMESSFTLSKPSYAYKLRFYSVLQSGSVVLDKDSVVSVMVPFNEDSMNRDQKGDIANKTIVATFVSTLPDSLQCHAREITALPAVPMLNEILLLIFHPASYQVEWLTNNQASKIVGFELPRRDKSSNANDSWTTDRAPIFLFRAEFSIEDVRCINTIRKSLSAMISNVQAQDDWETTSRDNNLTNRISMLPEDLQKYIIQLVQQKRNSVRSRNGVKAKQLEIGEQAQDSGFYPRLDIPKLNADSGYDSEEEEHKRRQGVVKRLKSIAFGISEHNKPSLLCKECGSTLCSLDNLSYEPTEWSPTLFRMSNCFGSVFAENYTQPEGPIDSYALCQQNHRIGYTIDGLIFVDSNCPVEIEKEGRMYSFIPEIWENNFAKIGGVSQVQVPREEPTSFDCEICDKSFKTRRLLASHLSSQRHHEEEQYYLGST